MSDNKRILWVYIVACIMSSFNMLQADDDLIKELAPLKSFIGKTWKGEFVDSTPDNPKYDISHWERALNGTAVRILHSVNDGNYGGETIIFWDSNKDSLVFYYFTTAGFYTHGTMTIDSDKFISHEKVTGNQDGITEVKATGYLLSNGKMKSESHFLKNGQWIKGHEIIYEEDPNAKVVFK